MGSRMSGMVKDYKNMYEIIKNWNERASSDSDEKSHYLYDMGWTIGDAPYHGYTGNNFENERYHYKNVEQKYKEFKKALEDAIGMND